MSIVLVPRLFFGSQDLRTLEVIPLGRDQAHVASVFWGGWKTGGPFFNSTYGYVYFNVCWVFLKIISLFTVPTEFLAIVVTRLVSLLSFIFLGVLSYVCIRRLFDIFTAITFSYLLFFITKDIDFIWRTTASQTDMLNLLVGAIVFFMCLNLAIKFTRKNFYLLSISLGVLMGIKYVSIVLFPSIFLVIFLHCIDYIKKYMGSNKYKTFVKVFTKKVVVMFLLYFAAFTFVSSRSLYQLSLINSYNIQSSIYAMYKPSLPLWLKYLQETPIGPITFLLFLIGSITIVYVRPIKRVWLVTLAYSWIYILFLSVFVGWTQTRFIYPALPALILVATIPLYIIWDKVNKDTRNSITPVVFAFFLMLALCLNAVALIQRERRTTEEEYKCLKCLPSIQAGLWIEKNISLKSKIMQDSYIYVPSKFKNVMLVPSGDPLEYFKLYNPDVLLVKGQYLRLLFSKNDDEYDEEYYIKAKIPKKFYTDLLSGNLDLQLVKTIGNRKLNNEILIFN